MTTQTRLTGKYTWIALLSGFFMGLGRGLGSTGAIAYTSNPPPTQAAARSDSTEIPTTGSLKGVDETDIYFPIAENKTTTFPIVLMLQVALVDKRDYQLQGDFSL